MEPKRLYRSVSDRKIAGVAGGLAEYLAVDPLLIRLLFVILFFIGGGGLLLYIIFWIVTPENHQTPPVVPTPSGVTPDPTNYSCDPSPAADATISPNPGPEIREKSRGSLIGGLILITLGSIFFADEFIPYWGFRDLWPIILVVIGVGLLINAVIQRKKP